MRALRVWVLVAVVAGTAGAVAMIPVGLAILQVPGATANVYGELLAHQLFGATTWSALFAVHMLVGWLAALPVVAAGWLLARAAARPPGAGWALLAGLIYGAGMWLVVNSMMLPWLYGRPNPWALGWPAIWPSLLVHLVYGAVTAYVVAGASRMTHARSRERTTGQRFAYDR